MINIRPVSDLRNKFNELEKELNTTNAPIFLTKNGHGSMVLMSIEQYSHLTNDVESYLDEADKLAKNSTERYTRSELFNRIRGRVNEASKL